MDAADQTVGLLGEAGVLRAILAELGPSRADVGPGDDAAVLRTGESVVATVDTLVHGPDFRLAWTGGFDLGWKAAAVNLADVAAMGARPTALLVALAMPDDTRVAWVRDLARGLRAACDALAPGCAVEGGDLTVSDRLTVAVTALGTLDGRTPVRRGGARAGDVVALAGDMGRAARGLEVLFERFRDADGRPVPVRHADLSAEEARSVRAQLRPCPPIAQGPVAADAGATAMMDVSDGLVLDARRLAAASGVCVDLARELLGDDPVRAFAGGEDHALLATFPTGAALPAAFTRIGVVRPGPAGAVSVDGEPWRDRGGWDPYSDWDAVGG